MLKLKKIALVVSLAAVMASSLIACGNKGETAKTTSSNSTKVESKDDYTIKLGYYNCDHMTAACVAKDAGIFDQLGLKVEVTGNGKIPQAMAAGQMDAGYIGFKGLNTAYAKGSPIIVAANNHDGGSYYLVVSNDIKNPAKDLIGQPMGIGSKPEQTDYNWEQMANDAGIPVKGENYKGINFDSDQAKYLAMKTGKIKGYVCCDPWGSMAEFEKTGRILSTHLMTGKELGNCCVFSLNKKFAKEHPELAKKMVLAHTKAIEYIYTHPLKAAKIFAKNYNVPEEAALLTVYKKTVGEGRTLSWKVDPKKFKHEMEFEISKGLYSDSNKYEDIVITKYLDESGADDFDKFIKEKVNAVFPLGMSFENWKAKSNEIDK
ncbi:ABC transporter substrate-binding protein [Clostridium sp. FP2]|uniref:ABC transporter substrate-binding subunit SaoX n=1 Tax=Clostridium TaxID=1485 RepID=UPI0013E95F95|nr:MULTISPECIES: ABC transporter substrate-binding subunit SaoX [Clostridium]MBW9158781.1 ABC transporter substrate-binding protein [Clostridium tagluense]MBZ9622206.1 ABC transporter substrate-binding protein [Clostridium sp. FP2]WLC66516.1 ABC transporter substrate-binding protein [Clostridium tagluense]